MCFPPTFISGESNCGGDTVTFSIAFSTRIFSSKTMVTFLLFTPRWPKAGDIDTMRGGVSS